MTIAWTVFFGESRDTLREVLPLDDATWARGRGWALWKALITLVEGLKPNGGQADDLAARRFGWRLSARDVIEEVLADHARLA